MKGHGLGAAYHDLAVVYDELEEVQRAYAVLLYNYIDHHASRVEDIRHALESSRKTFEQAACGAGKDRATGVITVRWRFGMNTEVESGTVEPTVPAQWRAEWRAGYDKRTQRNRFESWEELGIKAGLKQTLLEMGFCSPCRCSAPSSRA